MANPKITSTGFVGDLIGTASVAKSIALEPITGYGTTIAGFQNTLKAKVLSGSISINTHYRFVAAVDSFVANWNAGSTDYSIANGTYNELIPLSPVNTSSGGYAAFLLTTYFGESQYLMILNGGEWQKLEKVPSQADLTEIKAQITSASANYAPKSHSHVPGDIENFDSAVDTRVSANVTASNPTLSFGNTSTIGTIAGKRLDVRMPSVNIPSNLVTSKMLTLDISNGTGSANISSSVSPIEFFYNTVGGEYNYRFTVISGSKTLVNGAPAVFTNYATFSASSGLSNYLSIILPIQETAFASALDGKAINDCPLVQLVCLPDKGTYALFGDFTKASSGQLVIPSQEHWNLARTASNWVTSNSSSLSESIAQNRRDVSIYTGASRVTLDPGTVTVVTSLGSTLVLTLNNPTSDTERNLKEAVFRFKTGTTVPTITWPSGVYWANGEAPTIEANTYYECNFGYVVDKWCVAYQTFKEATA